MKHLSKKAIGRSEYEMINNTIKNLIFVDCEGHGPAYTEPDCEDQTQKVYFHVYDNYVDEKVNVYALGR